jgi:formate/nitrite transporter FocA (FNT family)
VCALLLGWGATALAEYVSLAVYDQQLQLPGTAGLLTLLPFWGTAVAGTWIVRRRRLWHWAVATLLFGVIGAGIFVAVNLWWARSLASDADHVASTAAVAPAALAFVGGFLTGIGCLAFLSIWPGADSE